ncbi:MAG: ABC transporter permease [Anaerolineales bacterium]|nr:ABC transporter permease [Anaerolineales bacterium]
MSILQLLIEALESLSSNKVRSALTMLGIIIGVGAVVAMMGIGSGAQNAITSQIESIGVNLLYVMPGGEASDVEPLTMDDAEAMANPAYSDSIGIVAPVVQGQVDVSIPGKSTNTSGTGITPEFFEVQTADIAEGQPITQAHVDNFSSVILLGSEVAQDLFDTTTGLIGKTVRIRGQIFKVIGVLEEQGGTGFTNNDNRVLVPISTAQLRITRRSQAGEVDMIYVQAVDTDAVQPAIDDVTQLLRARHRNPKGEDDFNIMSTQAFLETASAITGTMTLFLGGIAGISLLVGGIGIMNIMLVTVTERTREIGLRKALGARKWDIRIQFLVESSLLSLGGGIMGVMMGYGIAILIGQIAAASGTSLEPSIELSAILMATLFSATVGLFFGIYPANRAASLEPVEALRTE